MGPFSGDVCCSMKSCPVLVLMLVLVVLVEVVAVVAVVVVVTRPSGAKCKQFCRTMAERAGFVWRGVSMTGNRHSNNPPPPYASTLEMCSVCMYVYMYYMYS